MARAHTAGGYGSYSMDDIKTYKVLLGTLGCAFWAAAGERAAKGFARKLGSFCEGVLILRDSITLRFQGDGAKNSATTEETEGSGLVLDLPYEEVEPETPPAPPAPAAVAAEEDQAANAHHPQTPEVHPINALASIPPAPTPRPAVSPLHYSVYEASPARTPSPRSTAPTKGAIAGSSHFWPRFTRYSSSG